MTDDYRRAIETRKDRVDATNHVAHIGSDPKMEVIIRPYKKNRSNAQNRLMWLWHTQFGKEFGDTKEEAHEKFKEVHVLPILLGRDDEDADALREVEILCNVSPAARRTFVKLISSTMLNTAEFTDALNEYSQTVARDYGLAFTHPEDIYYEAMGRAQ